MKLIGFIVMLYISVIVSNIYTQSSFVSFSHELKLFGLVMGCWLLTAIFGSKVYRELARIIHDYRQAQDSRRPKRPHVFLLSSLWDRNEHKDFLN